MLYIIKSVDIKSTIKEIWNIPDENLSGKSVEQLALEKIRLEADKLKLNIEGTSYKNISVCSRKEEDDRLTVSQYLFRALEFEEYLSEFSISTFIEEELKGYPMQFEVLD